MSKYWGSFSLFWDTVLSFRRFLIIMTLFPHIGRNELPYSQNCCSSENMNLSCVRVFLCSLLYLPGAVLIPVKHFSILNKNDFSLLLLLFYLKIVLYCIPVQILKTVPLPKVSLFAELNYCVSSLLRKWCIDVGNNIEQINQNKQFLKKIILKNCHHIDRN